MCPRHCVCVCVCVQCQCVPVLLQPGGNSSYQRWLTVLSDVRPEPSLRSLDAAGECVLELLCDRLLIDEAEVKEAALWKCSDAQDDASNIPALGEGWTRARILC